MPSSRQAQMMRSAISPRFAMRTLLNIHVNGSTRPHCLIVGYSLRNLQREQPVAKLDGLAIFHVHGRDFAIAIAFVLVHQLHGFDVAETLSFFTRLPTSTNGGAPGSA